MYVCTSATRNFTVAPLYYGHIQEMYVLSPSSMTWGPICASQVYSDDTPPHVYVKEE